MCQIGSLDVVTVKNYCGNLKWLTLYSAMNVDTPFDVILHDGSDTFIITALRVLNLGNQFGSE